MANTAHLAEREAAEVDGRPDVGHDAESSAEASQGDGSGQGDSHRVGRNIGVLAGSQLVTWSMTVIWTLVVPRELGPGGLGLIVSATSVSSIIGIILAFAYQTYLVRELVRDPESGPQTIGTAIVLKLALVPLVVAVTVLFADLAHYGHVARVVLYYATAMTVFTAMAGPLQAAFQARERMEYLAYSNVINKTAQSLVGIVIVLIGFRAEGVMADMAFMTALIFVLNVWWLRRHMRIDLRTRLTSLVKMGRRSFVFLAASVFGMIYLWIDTIMLSVMTDSRIVGWYGATTTLFQTLLFLPLIISTAWLPRFVSAFKGGRDDLLRVARAPVELILVICIPLAAGTAMFAHVIVVGLYGRDYSHATPVLVALAVCIPPMSMNIILGQVAAAGGQERIWTGLMVVAAFVNPAINLGLITFFQHRQHNGAIGAGWAMVLTEVLLDTVGVFVVGRHVLDRGALKRVLLTCVASGGMLLTYHLASPAGQAVALTAGVLVLMSLAIALKVLNEDELGLVVAGLRKLGAKVRPQKPIDQGTA